MKKSLLLFFTLLPLFLPSQPSGLYKLDYIWLLGYDSNLTDLTFGGSILDFNTSPPHAYYKYLDMNIDVTNASMCDEEGNLLFYTNGIYIANREHEVMLNGDSLNPDPLTLDWRDDGYRLYQGVLTLPLPEDASLYYLFHEERTWVGDPVYWTLIPHMMYTTIDMELDGGLGGVIQKNKLVLEDTLDFGKLTAVRHANGRDWWLPVPEYNSNRYYRFLFDPEGLEEMEPQIIGEEVPSGLGQAVFSPDGSKYARMNGISATVGAFLDIYDFDRCSGLFSNHNRVQYPQSFGAQGVAISPNSRFLYVPAGLQVFQYDLHAEDIAASEVIVASYDGFVSPLPTYFFLAQLAPDGKIYICASSTVNVLHIIHKPDEKGAACAFEQHGLILPTLNKFSLPNFPNYRLGPLDDSPCDTLGLDNMPYANWRHHTVDTLDPLQVFFTDLSYYEPVEWSWDFGDGQSSTERHPAHTFPATGTYQVCLSVSNTNGSHTICDSVYVESSVATIEKAPEVQYLLFPNPNHGSFQLLQDKPQHEQQLFLYDLAGRPVHTQALDYTRQHSIQAGHLPEGMYICQIQNKGSIRFFEKIVIAR